MLRVLRDGHLCLVLATHKKGAHHTLSLLSKNYWRVWRSLGSCGRLRESVFNTYVTKNTAMDRITFSFLLPNGEFHREGDLPAYGGADGTKIWYKEGKKHREGDKPAMVWWSDGRKEWWKEGEVHRDGDKPAIMQETGSFWVKKGLLHRDGDLPAVVWFNRCERWYKNGRLHRDGDMPAIVAHDGSKEWWKEGQKHREGDKPAIILPDGTQEWWRNGERTE